MQDKPATKFFSGLFLLQDQLFVLKGNRQTGLSFEGLATCVSSTTTSGHIPVKIAKVLKVVVHQLGRLYGSLTGNKRNLYNLIL